MKILKFYFMSCYNRYCSNICRFKCRKENGKMKKMYNTVTESKKNMVIFMGCLFLIGYVVGFTMIKLA